jgi:hypothetical protein
VEKGHCTEPCSYSLVRLLHVVSGLEKQLGYCLTGTIPACSLEDGLYEEFLATICTRCANTSDIAIVRMNLRIWMFMYDVVRHGVPCMRFLVKKLKVAMSSEGGPA